MCKIIFISTVHLEMGKCQANELYKILKNANPEIIFLEALEENYSDYDKFLFTNFGVYHKKLEVNAIQKLSTDIPIKYIPVQEKPLPSSFDRMCSIICENIVFRNLIDNYNYLTCEQGFEFLNSANSIKLHEEMRAFEKEHLRDKDLYNDVCISIDEYENTMLNNINSYCKNNEFETGVFMCGSAHRNAIIKKINKFNNKEKTKPNWIIYGNY